MIKLDRTSSLLVLVLCLAAFLRFYQLGTQSIWMDEGFSIWFAKMNLHGIIAATARDTHPPLYYMLLHYWSALFGDSELAGRSLSALFGILTVFMTYRVGTVLYGEKTGILASLLLTVSSFHIYYSQEIRSYAFFLLVSLFSVYYFLMLMENYKIKNVILYILSTTVLMYTHVCGLFVILMQNIYLIIRSRIKPKQCPGLLNWVAVQSAMALLFIPWVIVLWAGMTESERLLAWIARPNIHSIISTIKEYSGSRSAFLIYIILLLNSVWILRIIPRYIGFNTEKNVSKSQLDELDKAVFLLLWVAAPVLLPYLLSYVITPIYISRVTIPALAPFFILIANGILNLKFKYLKAAVGLVVVVLSLFNLSNFYSTVNKEQWRDVAQFLDKKATPDDLLIFNSGTCLKIVFDYYSHNPSLKKISFPSSTKYVSSNNIKNLDRLVVHRKRVWLILSHSGDSKGLIKKKLAESFGTVTLHKYVGVRVYLFERHTISQSSFEAATLHACR